MPEWKEKRHSGARIAGMERVRLYAEPAVLTPSSHGWQARASGDVDDLVVMFLVVGDGIPLVHVERVLAVAAGQNIGAFAAFEDIISLAAVELVITVVAVELIVPFTAIEVVVAVTTIKFVVAVVAVELVVALAAVPIVVAVATIK